MLSAAGFVWNYVRDRVIKDIQKFFILFLNVQHWDASAFEHGLLIDCVGLTRASRHINPWALCIACVKASHRRFGWLSGRNAVVISGFAIKWWLIVKAIRFEASDTKSFMEGRHLDRGRWLEARRVFLPHFDAMVHRLFIQVNLLLGHLGFWYGLLGPHLTVT